MEAKLTVYFDDPFWAGVFERIEDSRLSVCKVTFGAYHRGRFFVLTMVICFDIINPVMKYASFSPTKKQY